MFKRFPSLDFIFERSYEILLRQRFIAAQINLAYEMFLWSLDESEFCAKDDLVDGLKWARVRFAEKIGHDSVSRLAFRIAHEAVRQIRRPEIPAELLLILDQCAGEATISPIGSFGASPLPTGLTF